MCNIQWIRTLATSEINRQDIKQMTGLYLRFLENKTPIQLCRNLHAVTYEVPDTKLLEIKGQLDQSFTLEILQERETFWLQFQLLGKSRCLLSSTDTLGSMQYRGCLQPHDVFPIEIDHSKNWLLLIGISGQTLSAIKQEHPLINQFPSAGFKHKDHRAVAINYYERRMLDRVQQLEDGYYSLPIALTYQISQFIHHYVNELQKRKTELANREISLYHQAVAYIQRNYMNPHLDRHHLAEKLHVTVRTLNRSFAGKNKNVAGAIVLIRLYKAQELLITSELNIEEIAFSLHFSSRKNFSNAYLQLFGHTPRIERENHRQRLAVIEKRLPR